MKKIIVFLTIVFCGMHTILLSQQRIDNTAMNVFIEALLQKMTLEEKIGQLNLPGSGDIVTGQASNSDIGKKIKEGRVGGLFNIKSIEKIKAIQKVAVEESLPQPYPCQYLLPMLLLKRW